MNGTGKDQILEAARRVIARSGIKDASMQAIAEEAGMTKGGLYYHYQGKDYILFELADRFLKEAVAPVKESLVTGNSKEELFNVILNGIARRLYNSEHNKLQFYLTHEAVLEKEELHELVVRKFKGWLDTTEEAIDVLYDFPDIKFKRALASSTVAMIDGQAIQLILEEDMVKTEELLSLWEAFFKAGIPAMIEYIRKNSLE
ncbi:TetR/AcrR family transcriptional regulator [Thermosyntropha sp.]|uniref:TetR/AcrR family transcriptional regulator n=1 Tax=Thermosyntropha sp. TaxID=2740820 RepID=UPI0025D7D92E|nr:TetR/AcrR family transcriptional regulator [Thermosyntropha sp.]MBO8159247.1 TetR/AcrR family transcriptional regulator [Thermosyntropha sp.]